MVIVVSCYDGCWMRDLYGPMTEAEALDVIRAISRHYRGKWSIDLIDAETRRFISWVA